MERTASASWKLPEGTIWESGENFPTEWIELCILYTKDFMLLLTVPSRVYSIHFYYQMLLASTCILPWTKQDKSLDSDHIWQCFLYRYKDIEGNRDKRAGEFLILRPFTNGLLFKKKMSFEHLKKMYVLECLNVQKSLLGISLRCRFSRSGADLTILHF